MRTLHMLAVFFVLASTIALLPAPTASACPTYPESDPCGPVCIVDVGGTCVVRQPCDKLTPCPESTPTGPDAGVCTDVRGWCPGFVCIWTAAKYTCVDPSPIIACGSPIGTGDAVVGVTYHDCTQVDGFVCPPTYMGGGGIRGGFVCRNPIGFHLP